MQTQAHMLAGHAFYQLSWLPSPCVVLTRIAKYKKIRDLLARTLFFKVLCFTFLPKIPRLSVSTWILLVPCASLRIPLPYKAVFTHE